MSKLRKLVDSINTFTDDSTGGTYNLGDVAATSQSGVPNIDELGKYDEGLKRGMSQEDVRAFNQPNYKAMGNSVVQLVTGTIGDLVASPGYMAEGVQSVADSDADFTNMFTKAGDWIKELGTENFPMYQDSDSKETLFNPFDGEWLGHTVAQFGPTVAMMAAAFLSDGVLYPALANKLSKIPMAGKYIKMGEQFVQGNKIAKTARLTFTSRAIEGGMEAVEAYNSNLEKIKRENPEMSEEDAKGKAGDIAARVYTHNWMLAATDFLEFSGVVSGFGKFGKLGKALPGIGIQMGTEAAEEGLQYAIGKEAEGEVMEKNPSSVLDEFFKGIGDTEMQQAMVQGALGGAVFSAIGGIADNLANNTKVAQKLSKDDLNKLVGTAALTAVKRYDKEGRLEVFEKDLEKRLSENVTPEEKANVEKLQRTLKFYKEAKDNIKEENPTIREKKLDLLFEQKWTEEQKASVGEELTDTDPVKIAQMKASSKTTETLAAKYKEELPEDTKTKSSVDDLNIKAKVERDIKLDEQLEDIGAKLDALDDPDNINKMLIAEDKAKAEEKIQKEISILEKAPNVIALKALKKDPKSESYTRFKTEKSKEEVDNSSIQSFETNDEMLEYYSDKPFSLFFDFGFESNDALKQYIDTKNKGPQINNTYVYNDKVVKIIAEVGSMYAMEDENGKKFKLNKDFVKKSMGSKIKEYQASDEAVEDAEVISEETVEQPQEQATLLQPKEEPTPKSVEEDIPQELKSKIAEIKANSELIQLSKDGKNYVNKETGQKYQRVTQFISDEEIDVEGNPLLKSSIMIGTKVDDLVRDFFDGNLKSLDKYDVSSVKNIDTFIKKLEEIKVKMDVRGEKVLANDIVLYNNEIGVAGTVDLLTYDKNGIFRIYDMKTMRGNNFTDSYADDDKVKYESTRYGKSKKEKHQMQISLYRILLNNTHGIKAETIGVMPIEVSYRAGDTTTKKLRLLKGVPLEPLNQVKTAILKSEDAVELEQQEIIEESNVDSNDFSDVSVDEQLLSGEKAFEEKIEDKLAAAPLLTTESYESEAVVEEVLEKEEVIPSVEMEPTWIKSFDRAMFKYNADAETIYITNHFGGEISIDEARAKYHIPKTLKHGEYYTLRDKEGYPIESGYIKDIKDYDVNVIRNIKDHENETVHFEIDNDLKFNNNETTDFSNVQIQIAIYPNGKRKVIGILSAFKGNDTGLRTLRESIYNSNNKEGVYQSTHTSKIQEVIGGKFNTFYDKKNRNKPSQVIPKDMPFILGVAYNIPGQEGAQEIVLNESKGNVNGDIKAFIEANNLFQKNMTHGALYVFSRDISGKIVPVRIFTKTVGQSKELKKELLKAIRDFDLDKARSLVKFKVNTKNGVKLVPDFNANLASEFGNINFTTKDGVARKDKNGNSYVDKYLVKGAVVAVKSPDGTYSKIYAIINQEKNESIELDADFNPIGEVKDNNLQPLINNGSLHLHYAYNYYRHYDIENKPLQIDHKQINTGNYNSVVDERLESDLVPQDNFHSPRIKIGLNEPIKESLQPTSIKEEEFFVVGNDKIGYDVMHIEDGLFTDGQGQYSRESAEDIANVNNKRSSNTKSISEVKALFPKSFKEIKPTQKLSSILTKTNNNNYIQVGIDYITDKNGKYYKHNGEEVTNVKIINEYLVNKNHNKSRIVEFNGLRYYVLPNNTIISLYSARPYREVFKKGTKRNKVLEILNSQLKKEDVVENKNIIEDKSMDIDDLSALFGDTKYRSVMLNVEYKKWDQSSEMQWLKEIFPNIPVKIHNALSWLRTFNVDAWGAYKNASVHIVNSAQTGTLYHEAFHYVMDHLPEKTRVKILKQAGERYGLTDKLEIEEQLADDFMRYKLSKDKKINVDNKTFFQRIGYQIKRFFENLYNQLRFVNNNNVTLDNLFYRIDYGHLNLKDQGNNSFMPKFRRIEGYTNSEYQDVLNTTANLLDKSIQEHLRLNPQLDINDVVKQFLIPSEGLSLESDNLIFSRRLKYSMFNQIVEHYNSIENIDDGSKAEFNKLIKSLGDINSADKSVTPKQLTYDILKNLSSRGIIINVQKNTVENAQLGESEIENDNTDLVENTDFRESWQVLSFSISPIENMGDELRLKLSNVPVLKWTNKQEGKYEIETGYLGFNKYYGVNHAYNQIQQIVGNSTSRTDMIDKLTNSESIIAKYIVDNKLADDQFIGSLWVSVGQKNHPRFGTVLQDTNKKRTTTKVVNTNANTLTNNITQDVVSGFKLTSPVYNKNGSINETKAKEAKSTFSKLRQKVLDATKNNYKRVLPAGLIEEFAKAFDKYGINIQLGNLKEANESKNAFFVKALAGKVGSFYSFFDNLVAGIDPIESNNSGMKDFLKSFKFTFNEVVQNAHKNPTGGQVFEWINANFLGRTINKLKNKKSALEMIETYQNDPLYKHSPLMNLIKNGHTNENPDLYFLDPEKIKFFIYSDIKLENKGMATEYSNMSEKDLNIALLAGYFNSNNSDGTAILPLPVLSDSPAMTGVQIPIIKNLEYDSIEKKRGILNYLNDVAYQEYIRIKLDRKSIKNQNKYTNKFVYFDIFEKEMSKQKDKLLKLDSEKDIKQVRAILEEGVKKQYKKLFYDQLNSLVKLGIINKKDNNYEFADQLMDNTPVIPFLKHFVGNFMFHQYQLGFIFNGDLTFYKNVGDYFKRAKQIWSPGTYLDTTKTRPTFNVEYLETNMVKKGQAESSYNEIKDALFKLFPDNIAKSLLPYYEEVDETDAQSYVDLYRYKEQQEGLWRWNEKKEASYQRLMRGEYNMQDVNEIFNVSKPFYYSHHLVDNQIIPTQNKNSEFVIIPAFVKKDNPLYNKEYENMLIKMGYEFDKKGNVMNMSVEEFETKRKQPNNKLVDQFAFDTAIKVGYYKGIHKYSNADWRLQMETPVHHVDDKVIFGTQVRKHMINDIDLSETYTLPNGEEILGDELLKRYNNTIINNIKVAYDKVAERFDSIDDLLNMLREEIIKRDLGNHYLEALERLEEDTGQLKTKLPLWHPLHLYRIESLLNSVFTKQVTREKLNNGVTLANLSSWGFKRKPRMVFKEDGSLDHMEVYAPAYSKKLYRFADENGVINVERVKEELGEEALHGIVWRIPNEDKYSTFNIKIIGFLPKESGGAIVMPPEVTAIAGLDFDIDKVYGFFYNFKEEEGKLTINKSSEETKKNSDNLMLDYMRAILGSKSSTKSFLQPGNFDTLKANNKVINAAKAEKRNLVKSGNEYVEDLNVGAPTTWVQIADQMNTGKALIGVSANANAAHAIFQHAKQLTLDEGFKFDKKEYTDLTSRDTASGKLITKTIAETLAAFVDNGKDPQAKYSNINSFTIDVAMSMALVGIDLDTIQFFLSQDIIEEFVTDYFNNNNDLNQTKDDYGIELNKNSATYNFDTKDLKEKLNGKDSGANEALLETFLLYKKIAAPVSRLVSAVKVGEAGLGPSDSHNLARLDMLEESNFEGINGAVELLERNDLFPKHLTDVIKFGRKKIIDSTGLPDRNKGAFKSLRDRFNNLKRGFKLNVNQIEFINKNYIDYLASDYFKFDKQLIANLPVKLNKLKSKDSKYKLLLDRLGLDVDSENNITYIVYTGISGQDKLLIDNIRSDWENMLLEGTEEEKQFAKDLVKYTYMLSGFRITPQSFSHLAPVKYYSEVEKEFNTYMNDKIRSAENSQGALSYEDIFFHQFIKNHFRSLVFVPVANIDTNVVKSSSNNNNIETVSVKSDDFKDNDQDFLPYIKMIDNGKLKLLRLDNVITNKNGDPVYATYVITEPLGTYKRTGLTKGKMFTYYEFGNVGENIFKQNLVPTVDVVKTDTVINDNRKVYKGLIQSLDVNQVFVFGSNPEGRHGAGTAKIAKDKYRAKYGQGRGAQGNSYALPTKNLKAGFVEESTGIKYERSGARSLSPEQIITNIKELYNHARANKGNEFLVAYTVAPNLNGYSSQELANMFYAAGKIPSNVIFNEDFDKLITLAELEESGEASTTC